MSLLQTSRLDVNWYTADYLIRQFGGAFLAQAERWGHAGQHLVHISVMNTATGRGDGHQRAMWWRGGRGEIGHSQGIGEERKTVRKREKKTTEKIKGGGRNRWREDYFNVLLYIRKELKQLSKGKLNLSR